MSATVRYGKAEVSFYRTGLGGRALFGAEVDLDVFGDEFLASYTEGDNTKVVATDTMKNFVHEMALEYGGSTLEGFLAFLGRRFLETYAHVAALRLRAKERPFVPAAAPGGRSDVLFRRSGDDAATAEVDLTRERGPVEVTGARSGRVGMRLIKVTGSSFARFLRDSHTTLPEMVDRPLYIHFDVHWRYGDLREAIGDVPARYLASDAARDFVEGVFHEFNSRSIQHLVHEMGRRMLERFAQIDEVEFDAQNRLWETARESAADPTVKVYTDPRPTYGRIGLVLRRD
ncbi:MAG TPA: urate oxidase [Candidatus Limnocylindrales bacterium]|nr:urate oxidase [Candidatus Limnocylindrales bacterium]